MNHPFTRRELFTVGAAAAFLPATNIARGASTPAAQEFRYCLNTSTISGQKLSLAHQVAVAAKAGYDSIELWMRDIQKFVENGGKLTEIRKQLDDAGLKMESAIGFANWIVDDDKQRRKGLADAERDMRLVKQLGGSKIAAPPAGAHRGEKIDLDVIAERYATLLAIGEEIGVSPLLEIWGSSQNLSRLSELAYVAVAAGRADVHVLPDVYHIYRGGSSFESLCMFRGASIGLFHMNDYPDIARDKITDADRVYPGDGVAPLSDILQSLDAIGYRGALSLELFNREYWKQDALTVARTGLERMKAAVAKARQA